MKQLSYCVENCWGILGTENVELESILLSFFLLIFHHLTRKTEMTLSSACFSETAAIKE